MCVWLVPLVRHCLGDGAGQGGGGGTIGKGMGTNSTLRDLQ